MRNLTLPAFLRFRSVSLGVEAHSRGLMEAGAAPQLARGRGARWVATFETTPLTKADAFALRAWLHRLRGAAGSFELLTSPPATVTALSRYTDETTFSDGTTFDDVLSPSVLVDDLADGATSFTGPVAAAVGDVVEIADADGYQAVRIVSVSGSFPDATLTFRPALRRAYNSPTVLKNGARVPLRLRADPPAVPIIPGGRSAAVTLECEEAY